MANNQDQGGCGGLLALIGLVLLIGWACGYLQCTPNQTTVPTQHKE